MANKYGKKSKMEKKKTSRQEVAVAKVEQRMQQRSYFPYINILLQVLYIVAMFAIIIVDYQTFKIIKFAIWERVIHFTTCAVGVKFVVCVL